MPDPEKVLSLVRRAAVAARSCPGRAGGLVSLPEEVEEVVVAGDLHGNVHAFRSLLQLADLRNRPGRHLVLQELVHGDLHYPNDGGDRSHQLLDVVSALICENPARVHLILGNHELSELTGRSIAKGGVKLNEHFQRGVETAYGERAGEIIAAYHTLFRSLPLAVRTSNRVMLCHTIPDEPWLDNFDPGILNADSWSDRDMARGGSVYGITWGRDTRPGTVDRFAEMVDADFFVTGHQPFDEGFARANHRQLIIDATPPLPCCCLFPARGPIDLDKLVGGVRRLAM
jgi:hypothetical protein